MHNLTLTELQELALTMFADAYHDHEEYTQEQYDAFNAHMDNFNQKVKNPYVKPFTQRMSLNKSFDTYDIAVAYELDAIRAHAVKKILVPGERGVKSVEQDIDEAIWSLQEFKKEINK